MINILYLTYAATGWAKTVTFGGRGGRHTATQTHRGEDAGELGAGTKYIQ